MSQSTVSEGLLKNAANHMQRLLLHRTKEILHSQQDYSGIYGGPTSYLYSVVFFSLINVPSP